MSHGIYSTSSSNLLEGTISADEASAAEEGRASFAHPSPGLSNAAPTARGSIPTSGMGSSGNEQSIWQQSACVTSLSSPGEFADGDLPTHALSQLQTSYCTLLPLPLSLCRDCHLPLVRLLLQELCVLRESLPMSLGLIMRQLY
jgi:hypothetical protein